MFIEGALLVTHTQIDVLTLHGDNFYKTSLQGPRENNYFVHLK